MNNKAQGQYSTVVVLVITILVAVIVVFLGKVVYDTVTSENDEAVCNISNILGGIGRGSALRFVNPFELYCPRNVILVEDNKFTRFGKGIFLDETSKLAAYSIRVRSNDGQTFVTKTKQSINWDPEPEETPVQTQMEQLVAYEMSRCWEQFKEGSVIGIENSFWSDSRKCFICSEIVFNTDELTERVELDMQTFLDENPTHVPGKEDLTHYAYLYNSRDPANSIDCKEKFESSHSLATEPLSVAQGESALVMLYFDDSAGRATQEYTINEDECLSVQYASSRRFPAMCEVLIN